jgi:hypothetical protein
MGCVLLPCSMRALGLSLHPPTLPTILHLCSRLHTWLSLLSHCVPFFLLIHWHVGSLWWWICEKSQLTIGSGEICPWIQTPGRSLLNKVYHSGTLSASETMLLFHDCLSELRSQVQPILWMDQPLLWLWCCLMVKVVSGSRCSRWPR